MLRRKRSLEGRLCVAVGNFGHRWLPPDSSDMPGAGSDPRIAYRRRTKLGPRRIAGYHRAMAEKRENPMARHLRSLGVPEAKVPESEKGVTTVYFGLGRIGARLRRKKKRERNR